MKYREAQIGPFVREVGDFIAHNKRDKGATLDTTAFMFAQLAFFQTYQSKNKRPLEHKGACAWWLRHYLLTKAKCSHDKALKKTIGLNRRQAARAIRSWFPENTNYPTTINCDEPALLHAMASNFSRAISGSSVFNAHQARIELSRIFEREGIDQNEFDRFVIATAILLAGKSVEIVPGFNATITLSVDERYIPLDENGEITTAENSKFVRPLPDGVLKVMVSTDNQTGDGLVGVALELMDTNIDTEWFFDRVLVEIDEHRLPRLKLDRQLSFDSTRTRPVHH
jgi:hypothetical protein